MNELYEVRNYRTAESVIFADLAPAIAALAVKEKQDGHWYLSRVSDGALWRDFVASPAPHMTLGFGRRIYTTSGDQIRLQRASVRAIMPRREDIA
jgi:hypothetical protein